MKRILYATIILSVILLLSTFSSCYWYYSAFSSDKPDTMFCIITDFDANIYATNKVIREGGYLTTWETTKDTLTYNKISLKLKAWKNDYRICRIHKSYYTPFITTTYAVIGPVAYPSGKIENISIYSNIDYNSQYKKGEILNKIFQIHYVNEMYGIGDEYDAFDRWEQFYDLETYLSNNPESAFEYDFVIYDNMPPDSIKEHIFTIIYKKTDGTIIEEEFEPVIITY